MIIRQAEQHDIPTIARIHIRSWQDTYGDLVPADLLAALSAPDWEQHWQRQLGSAHTTTTVVEIDGAVVGFSCWELCSQPHSVTAFLHSLYLLPQEKGKGMGSELIRIVEAQMSAANATAGSLHVVVGNVPASGFYERRGWHLIPDSHETEHFIGIDLSTVTYSKDLS